MDEAEILESGGGQDRDLWLDRDPADFGVDDSSIFYSDNFPSLPDFPCISSSSSSLSSSSSSMTWNTAMEIPPLFDPQIDVDCSNVMQELGDMDLLDTNNMWEEQQEQKQRQEEGPQDEGSSEDLGTVFLEWLKSNKESISAEDLRSITLKKSTVECAARRLGGGKEGMTQLLKLILQWVQNHHLHKRRMRAGGVLDVSGSPSPNPNPTLVSPDSHLCFSPSMPWIPHQTPFYADPTAGFPPMLAYMGDPAFAYGFPMIDTRATWSPPHFSLYNSYRDQQLTTAPPPPPPPFGSGSCGNHYLCGTQMLQERGERVRKIGSLATKEARKKRMARQKRFLSHHQRQHATLASDANCTTSSQLAKPGGNCVFWPSTASVAVMPSDVVSPSSDPPPLQPHHQRQFTSERHQEKNLRFLLQKVLKQSDVGTLGRIVLPKKEAEMHLPELESRDGISILVEDIGTSRIWNMRYRDRPLRMPEQFQGLMMRIINEPNAVAIAYGLDKISTMRRSSILAVEHFVSLLMNEEGNFEVKASAETPILVAKTSTTASSITLYQSSDGRTRRTSASMPEL
ncbi:hypothetical protein NE237_016214 [Protea cynaroides]|uniref:Uncharacterized protein n=1 Tax=Protea cynaroides TaxID=273540 RepID=A0A9Q0KF62_9MAGN|nr:hypothetical protein NE237_016214 [Protea cynaroides]